MGDPSGGYQAGGQKGPSEPFGKEAISSVPFGQEHHYQTIRCVEISIMRQKNKMTENDSSPKRRGIALQYTIDWSFGPICRVRDYGGQKIGDTKLFVNPNAASAVPKDLDHLFGDASRSSVDSSCLSRAEFPTAGPPPLSLRPCR